MSILINVMVIFGLFTMVFLSPACMNIGLVRISNEDYTIKKSEFLLCCIPVFNHFYGWKKYSGKILSLAGFSSILFYTMFIIRIIVMFLFYNNETLQMCTIYGFLISVLAFWICNAVNIFSVLSDSGIYTFMSKVVNAFTVVIGQVTIGYYMPHKMRYYSNSSKKGILYE